MGGAREGYQPRHAETSVLHGINREHLDDFLRAAAARAEGAALPDDRGGRRAARTPRRHRL